MNPALDQSLWPDDTGESDRPWTRDPGDGTHVSEGPHERDAPGQPVEAKGGEEPSHTHVTVAAKALDKMASAYSKSHGVGRSAAYDALMKHSEGFRRAFNAAKQMMVSDSSMGAYGTVPIPNIPCRGNCG
jgi:hypothetical protein